MSARIPVSVHAADPILRAGVTTQLRVLQHVHVVDDVEGVEPAVAVVVADQVDETCLQQVRSLQRGVCQRVLLIVTNLDDAGMLAAVECGVCGLLRRSEATPERLADAARAAAAGDGTVPPDLLGRLLQQVGRLRRDVLHPRGLTFTGLTEREVTVLGLIAQGEDTREIANRLAYSERTIKNIVHDLTTRLNLRNRTHAVAYAMRNGLI